MSTVNATRIAQLEAANRRLVAALYDAADASATSSDEEADARVQEVIAGALAPYETGLPPSLASPSRSRTHLKPSSVYTRW